MSLKLYKSKRKFSKTPEPKPSKGKKTKELFFCVQKHDARRLHYDFRLELDGVLLSWAIPKGPSLNPHDKRLAIKVEDHPLEYGTFEGVIPEGNYGAGTVELWDKGTYNAIGASGKQDSEKLLRQELEKGQLKIDLHGEKLHGGFALIKIKSKDSANAWLLIKEKDSNASEDDITLSDYSVKTHKRSTIKKKKTNNLSSIKKSKKPDWFTPMLAKLIDKPFDNEDWLFEIKWDGYRALSFVKLSDVNVLSRNRNSFNRLYPPVVDALKKLHADAIFDGEIVALDEKGQSKFELLKNYQRHQKGELCYYIFDVLYYDGRDLRGLPLIERKDILRNILEKADSDVLRFSDHIEGNGIKFFKEAEKNHLEGIIGKKKNSPYLSKRSSDWVKIKTALRQEAVIGGFTEPKGKRMKFGALLLGVYDAKGLKYIGHVGTGFNEKTLNDIYQEFEPLIQDKSPFATTPKPNAKVTWVKPKLVGEISFAEWTADGKIRQPVFHGLRIDKPAKQVKKEIAAKEASKLNKRK